MNNCPHGYTTRKACSLCVSADDDAEIASLCAQLTAETARADAAEKERDAAREFGEGMTRAATEERNRVFDDLTTAKARSAALEAMLVRWLSADTWENHVEPMAILADDTRDLLTPAPASPLTDEEIAERAMGVLCDFIPYPEAVLPEGVDDAVKRAIRHALRLARGGVPDATKDNRPG